MPIFKDFTLYQLQFPLFSKDFISENHLVRIVNTVVYSLMLRPLYDKIQGKRLSCESLMDNHMKDIVEDVFYEVIKLLTKNQIKKCLRHFNSPAPQS